MSLGFTLLASSTLGGDAPLHYDYGTTYEVIEGYLLGGAGLATILGIGRLVLRKYKRGGLLIDDYIHVFAVFNLIVCAVTYTVLLRRLSGQQLDQGFVDPGRGLWILDVVWISFYWAAIFSARACFLAMYGTVFRVSTAFRAWWWTAIALTICAYLIAFLSMFWSCGTPSDFSKFFRFSAVLYDDNGAAPGLEALALRCYPYSILEFPTNGRVLTIIAMVCNIFSDLMIIILPIPIIWGLPITLFQKIRVAAVFALGLGTIAVDVFAWDLSFGSQPFFMYLEALVAVMISSLPPYGLLWKHRSEFSHIRLESPDGTSRRLRSPAYQNDSDIALDQRLSGTTRASRDATLTRSSGTVASEDLEANKTFPSVVVSSPIEEEESGEQSTATGIPQHLQVEVPTTTRSYWNLPGLRWSTRTIDWPLPSLEKPASDR